MRDSDPDAALYWLARMLEAGEDPLFVARRLVRFASEDVGNADPGALAVTLAAKEAYRLPRARPRASWRWRRRPSTSRCAPKSNAVYAGVDAARDDVRERPPSRCRCTCATPPRGS